MVGILRSILEPVLLSKALEYGGYNKIPISEVKSTTKVAVVATLIIKGLSLCRSDQVFE